MLRSLVLAGLLILGAAASASAGSIAETNSAPAPAADQSEHWCDSDFGPWQPGTLQIDERDRIPGPSEQGPRFNQAPAQGDCALA